ncbi:thiol:disulfide interchange protein DsbA/DsbL [Kitasatospora sp. NPDC054939]
MKSLLKSTVLLAVATGIAATPVQAGAVTREPPREGTQYSRTDQPQSVRESTRTEAVEFFWYSCGHSQELEQPLQQWAARHTADVELRRVPAIWQGSPEERVQRGHARLYYTLERLGLVEQLQTGAFHAVRAEKADLTDETGAVAWAVRQGVDAQRFRDAYRSSEVDRSIADAIEQFTRYGINELPTVVVQGQYRTSPTSAGGAKEMPAVLDHLVQQDQEARKKEQDKR